MDVVVQRGHTFWYYSQLLQIPLTLIVQSNRGKDPNRLQIGDTVKIPGYIATDYTVKAGDTFWSLASARGLPLDAVFLVNPNIDPNRLQIGQIIKLPARVTWRVVEGGTEYDYDTLVRDIRTLLTIYPFIQQQTIGESVMQKAIPEIRVGVGAKRVHVNGSFHANEWITTPVLMLFLNDYLLALTNQTSIRGLQMLPLYEQTMLSIVPMVNPDGVDLVINGPPEAEPYRDLVLDLNAGSADFSGWKANIRGVDLNNQFPAKWEIEAERKPQAPAPRDYPGERPLSEPEAIAIAELTRARDFHRVLAFHSQGEVIFWGFEGYEPFEAETIVNEFERVSGYTPIRYVDSYAGYKDWFIQEWRRPGYTVEVGTGVNPLPLSQFEEIYQENLGILLASLYM